MDKSGDSYKDHLYALILAGGGGTRLWPRSRNKTPKQFLKLFKNTTLTQITAKRFTKILPWNKIYCVTVSDEYKKEILREVPHFLSENILVEPARRDTGPAHGLGAAYLYNLDPEAVIITEAADRLVKPVSRYLSVLKAAAKTAYDNHLMVTVGVEPRYPHVGYGHIKKGKKWGTVGRDIKFYKLDKFVEKPPLNLAKRYTSSGNYFWNAGQFVWRADDLLAALQKHAPKIEKHLKNIMDTWKTKTKKDDKKVIDREYKSMSKISIDYAVAEKAKNFLVVAADFFWTDIGDWKEVWENLSKDELGNVIIDGDEKGGSVYNIDTSDALIHTNGRPIAVIDVDNVVVVDTKDALLVCSKSKAQNVKKIVNKLKQEGRKELL
jgi:mannose-1-phosphate guanylyltransferase